MEKQIRFTHGERSVGSWVTIGSPAVAEVIASLDVEFVVFDTEHTTIGLETLENMVRGVEAMGEGAASIVRVPWNDRVHIKRVLDIGVDGVLVPMIETAEEARSLVESVRYPPDGARGIGSGRASGYGQNFQEYVQNGDDGFLTIAQIESQRGVENIEEIASVDGIDALFLGPADLSGSLDAFAEWESDVLNRHIERALQVSREEEIAIGTLVIRKEDVAKRIEQGFDFVAIGKDTATLAAGTEELIDEYERSVQAEQSQSTTN